MVDNGFLKLASFSLRPAPYAAGEGHKPPDQMAPLIGRTALLTLSDTYRVRRLDAIG